MNNELMEKAKQAKSAEELLAIAKENGIEATEEEAKQYFAQLHSATGELSDDELDNVSGGGCNKGDGRLVVTIGYSCGNWACKYCGQKVAPSSHRCPKHTYKLMELQAPGICNNCDYMSYEKGLWLCNHPANKK